MSNKKITELTQEQLDAIPKHRDEWIAHGLSTEPANRKEAEEGVVKAYRAADLAPPKHFVWRDSPYSGVRAASVLFDAEDNFKTTEELENYLSIHTQGPVKTRKGIWRSIYGAQEASRLSFLDFFAKYCDLEHKEEIAKLEGLVQVAKNAGWWWPFETVCVISERPSELHRDDQNRLHKEDGPAIAYPDGWGVYSWHGTRVPADLIMDGWSTDRIFQEDNTEIRRCAVEKMGWPEFVEQAKLVQVGEEVPDPANPPYTLSLYDLPEQIFEEPVRVLLCTNATEERDGTRRKFGLTVPASISDPIAAAGWTFGLGPTEYKQLVNAS